MVNVKRWLKHTFALPWAWRRAFRPATLDAIESAIRNSENHHDGEICFAVEPSLAPAQVWHGLTGRARAIEVFAEQRVWDTEHNSGVLIYVLLADQDIEIVADRGINACVPAEAWAAVARTMEAAFRRGDFEAGALAAIEAVDALLAEHFPPRPENPDELANRPVILRR